MYTGYLDVIQVIYYIFEEEPAAEILPVAKKSNVGVIIWVAFDEGMLTGKYSAESTFSEGDFRNNYFDDDRLSRAVERVELIKNEIKGSGLTMPQGALKFPLCHESVSTVIPWIRNNYQANANSAVSDLEDLSETLIVERIMV